MQHFFCLLFILTSFQACNEKLSESDLTNIDYCKHFELTASQSNYNGQPSISASPKINFIEGDKVSRFINKYPDRFLYLLYDLQENSSYKKFYPDTLQMKEQFCKDIQSKIFSDLFKTLTGVGFKEKISKPEIYSQQELMKTVSRFFMCDQVNNIDTTINYHICVGLNGMGEFQRKRNYTALEAICFEAIFTSMRKKGQSKFIANFHRYITEVSTEEKKNFINFNDHLKKVKERCYDLMEKDNDLKEVLLQYYDFNKDNIGFIIQ